MMAQSDGPANPFAVDPTDELPEGLQLGVRLRALISTGYLAAGEALPSVRQMEQLAGVNLSMVRAVYAHLEDHGLAVRRHGQGTFVAEDLEAAPALEDMATAALQEAQDAGLSPRALADVVLACASIPDGLKSVEDGEADDSTQAHALEAIETGHELRQQIARLDAELTSYPRESFADAGPAAPASPASVDSIEELEQIREARIAQLTAARLEAERRIRSGARRRLLEQEEGLGARSSGPLGRAMGRWRDER
jgi:DNA-binding transcriptional regulator YhcF (GntR family)